MSNDISVKFTVTKEFVAILLYEASFRLLTDVEINVGRYVRITTHTPDYKFVREITRDFNDDFIKCTGTYPSDEIVSHFDFKKEKISGLKDFKTDDITLDIEYQILDALFITDKYTFKEVELNRSTTDYWIYTNKSQFIENPYKDFVYGNQLFSCPFESYNIMLLKHFNENEIRFYSRGKKNGNMITFIFSKISINIVHGVKFYHDDKLSINISGALRKLSTTTQYDLQAYENILILREQESGIENCFYDIKITK